jgi:hypothetical protein
MKNIHLLPTDNYAPLVHSTNKYGGYFKSEHYSPMKEMGDSYQHIYITSNEEIKEGDWVFNFEYIYIVQYDSKKHDSKFWYKKIILTTDQDLIKDGVQAIDDEFLEWFVKNPSCEEVEIEKYGYMPEEPYDYKIIIPKEEPKQETLEEAAHEYFKRGQLGFEKASDTEEAFLKGAKWMQERMYSEEEVYILLEKSIKDCHLWELEEHYSGNYKNLTEWFEQFKKKANESKRT